MEDSLPTQMDVSYAQPLQEPPHPLPTPIITTSEMNTSRGRIPQPRHPYHLQDATQLAPPLAQPNPGRGFVDVPTQQSPAIPRRDVSGASAGQATAAAPLPPPQTFAGAQDWPEEEVWGCGGQPFQVPSVGSAEAKKGVGAHMCCGGEVQQQARVGVQSAVENLGAAGVEGSREALVRQLMEVDLRVLSGIASSHAKWRHLSQVNRLVLASTAWWENVKYLDAHPPFQACHCAAAALKVGCSCISTWYAYLSGS